MDVIINGIAYAPKASASPHIGIGITTHNRPDVLKRAIDNHQKHFPEGAKLVVVDDGSAKAVSVPPGIALVRHDEPKGIAAAKNACIAALMAEGCDHIFLFDDDTWPDKDGWWKPYVESREPHLMYLWGDKFLENESIVAYPWPKGCMLYAERRVIDRIGGMNLAFGRWGCEHMEWSDRIHNAGFTTCRYQDVPGSESLIHACDRRLEVESSVPVEIRKKANTQQAIAGRYADNWLSYLGEQRSSTRKSLSILVPSVSSRRSTFAPKMADQLFGQLESLHPQDRERVEVLILTDAKGIVLGDKRNAMVRMAQGDYVVFVDDDDRIEPDYVKTLLDATKHDADCITFHAMVSLNASPARLCRYSIKFKKDENTGNEYRRLPNHITAVKRDIALRCPFPSKGCGEDADYAVLLRPMLKSEHPIDRVLYHYDYNDKTTETQGHPEIHVGKAPIVDVVMLSKASTPELKDMAQEAIDTCLSGCGNHAVSVVVIEQVPGVRYRDAVTIHETGEFNYNAFANMGARMGVAPWVMIANSDLKFHDGWLDALLSANHPVVSPVNPLHQVQNTLAKNEKGSVNGRNFSGWCFMLKREIFDKIGGLDEDFRYWCADDSAIAQLVKIGIQPMVVPSAKVTHLVSKTLKEPSDDLTWAMVHKFEQKYGIKKFERDARYADWKRKNLK